MNALQQLAHLVFYGNTVMRWSEAILIFLVLLTVLPLVRLTLDRRLRRLPAHKSPTALELAVALEAHTTRLFIFALSVYVALKSLTLPVRVDRIIDVLIEIAIWVQVAIWGTQAAVFLIDRRTHQAGDARLPTFVILRFISLLLVWALAVLMLLANLGVNITALVTSLGIGGVAFALAIQNVLGDVLASLAIAWDKPFQLGDELRFGDVIGKVEQIGIKSTRLRSIDGEQIVIGNTQLLQQQIHNFGRAQEQRTTLVLTLAFDTPGEQLREFPAIVERVAHDMPTARFDHCNLRALGGNGFEYEVSLFATEPGKVPLREVRERFVLALLEQLPGAGLAFGSGSSPVLVSRAGQAAAHGSAPSTAG